MGRTPHIVFVLLFLFLAHVSHAQREPQYTQYMYNIGSFNPGYVASVPHPEIALLYRAQWLDIDGAPRTIRFGTNIPFSNEQHGLGFNILNDQIGPVAQTHIRAAYAYQVNLSDNSKLSFGMDVGGSFLNVDFSKGTFENPGEPILNQENISRFYPTIGAGLFLHGLDTWYLGVSIPNFLTDEIYNDDVATIVEDHMHLNFIGGYVFELSDNLKFKPAFLLHYVKGSPMNMNLSTNFLIKERFTLGGSYRFGNAFSGLVGLQISNPIFFGYSYDYDTTPLGAFNSGTHELILKFYLGRDGSSSRSKKGKDDKKNTKQIDTPRFF